MLNNKNIIAAGIIALAIFGFFSFILPEYDSIKAARSMLQERQTRLSERTALVAKVDSLNEEYQKNKDNISKLGSLLPTDKHHDEIVSSISVIANQAGVTLTESSIGDTPNQQASPVKITTITIQGTGTYDRIYNLLELIQKSLRLYEVQSISLGTKDANTGGTAAGTLTFEIKINASSIN